MPIHQLAKFVRVLVILAGAAFLLAANSTNATNDINIRETSGGGCTRQVLSTALSGKHLRDVEVVQTALLWRSYPVGTVDGRYGPQTARAVTKFQQDNSLVPDGKVGPATWGALGLTEWNYPCSQNSPPPTASAVSAPVVGGGAAAAVAFALAQLGDPYVWGANGPDAWDCSGLIVGAARVGGVSLPRVTHDQMLVGRPVSVSEMAPGDLVFGQNGGHVGMYIGGGEMVHSPNSRSTVKISTVNNGYYNYATSGVRRIF